MNNPLVTICIPTYNRVDYLELMLESISKQSYKNIEVIIGDNASTDNSEAVIKSFVDRFGFQYIKNETNLGSHNNVNNLITKAAGELIAIYHDDDIYEPVIVEECVNIFNQYSSVGLVGTMKRNMDSDGNLSKQSDYLQKCIKSFNKEVYSFHNTLLGMLKSCAEGHFFVTPTIMVRREAYEKLGLINYDNYKSASDYEMWLRISKNYGVYIIDKPLLRYRIHTGQDSQKVLIENLELLDIHSVVKKYREYVDNREFGGYIDKYLNMQIFETAYKNNLHKNFSKSIKYLDMMDGKSLVFSGKLLYILNKLKISLKKPCFFRHFFKRTKCKYIKYCKDI